MQPQIFPFQNSPLAKYAFAAIAFEKVYRKFKTMFGQENAEDDEGNVDDTLKKEPEIDEQDIKDVDNAIFSIDELKEIANPSKTPVNSDMIRIGVLLIIAILFYKFYM